MVGHIGTKHIKPSTKTANNSCKRAFVQELPKTKQENFSYRQSERRIRFGAFFRLAGFGPAAAGRSAKAGPKRINRFFAKILLFCQFLAPTLQLVKKSNKSTSALSAAAAPDVCRSNNRSRRLGARTGPVLFCLQHTRQPDPT